MDGGMLFEPRSQHEAAADYLARMTAAGERVRPPGPGRLQGMGYQ